MIDSLSNRVFGVAAELLERVRAGRPKLLQNLAMP